MASLTFLLGTVLVESATCRRALERANIYSWRGEKKKTGEVHVSVGRQFTDVTSHIYF